MKTPLDLAGTARGVGREGLIKGWHELNTNSRCDKRLGSEEEKHDDNPLADRGEKERKRAAWL